MAADAFKVGKVAEAQKLLSKAHEHLHYVDACFDDLPSQSQLALTDKVSSESLELPHSGKTDGDTVAPHVKPSTSKVESTLPKKEGPGSDAGSDDGRMPGEGVVSKSAANFADKSKQAGHFEMHGAEFGANSADEYLSIAQDIKKHCTKVQYPYKAETRTGDVQLMGNNRKGKLQPFILRAKMISGKH
ncbi:hypothetical protein [Photobacterium sp. 53610]|uniref:hypothetical protein n=1 Tax=Photobacterium sp. 53610 TaxID=3102789 RepID=UPI002ED88735